MAIAAHHYQIDTYVVSFKNCVINSSIISSLTVSSKSTEIIIHTIMFSCLLSFDSPINFLRSSKSNRFAIAATFGATASTCLVLFVNPNLDNFFPEDSHPWVKGISTL